MLPPCARMGRLVPFHMRDGRRTTCQSCHDSVAHGRRLALLIRVCIVHHASRRALQIDRAAVGEQPDRSHRVGIELFGLWLLLPPALRLPLDLSDPESCRCGELCMSWRQDSKGETCDTGVLQVHMAGSSKMLPRKTANARDQMSVRRGRT